MKCKNSKKDDNRFVRFSRILCIFHLKSSLFIISTFLFQCYYVGGLDESATGMLGEVSKPVSWGMPAEKICMKLYKKDAQICDIKYGKHYKIT